ncbi:MAG: hypothetical protein M3362_26050 [Acidobacteriota bacterium]|nr:hypothetical protein [Acidobacteriota bacterium]
MSIIATSLHGGSTAVRRVQGTRWTLDGSKIGGNMRGGEKQPVANPVVPYAPARHKAAEGRAANAEMFGSFAGGE